MRGKKDGDIDQGLQLIARFPDAARVTRDPAFSTVIRSLGCPFGAQAVPEIARFLGLVIRMYYNDHDPPHFHASYAGYEGRLRISPIGVMDSDLPPRALALAVEWASLHESELLENWRLARAGKALATIAPLE